MRRNGSMLHPIDRAIIRILDQRMALGSEGVHGYELAPLLARTVYKALYRLSRCRAVVSHWEDADVALEAGRPRRRYYVLTENGLARARLLDRGERLRAYLARVLSTPEW